MSGNVASPLRPPYTDLYPDKVPATQNLADVADTVMPSVAAAAADLEHPERKVDIVVNHNQIPGRNPQGSAGRAHARAAEVHVGLRQQNGGLHAGDAAHAIDPLMTFFFQGD